MAEELGRESLQRQKSEADQGSGSEKRQPPGAVGTEDGEHSGVFGGGDVGRAEARDDVDRGDADGERGGEGGDLGGEDGAEANGEHSQDEAIAARGQDGVPGQHTEESGDRHGCGHQKLLFAAGHDGDAGVGQGGTHIFRHGAEGEGEAKGGQHGGELHQDFGDVAAGGEDFQIDQAEQEVAVENAKLFALVGHDQPAITSTSPRVMAEVSCSTASWEKMPSRVGWDIRARSCSMESLATTRPLWRMTMWDETRSTVSSSCE